MLLKFQNSTETIASISTHQLPQPYYFCYLQRKNGRLMKKLIIGIFAAIVLILSIYLFIPGRLKVDETIIVTVPLPSMTRLLSGDWAKWWPADSGLIFKKKKFLITARSPHAFQINIVMPTDSVQSLLSLAFIAEDSMLVNWQTEVNKNSSNPIQRFTNYNESRKLGKDIRNILMRLKGFAENPKNIYNINVIETHVTDAILISTRRSFDHKPDVNDIDSMIRKLRNYIAQNGAVEKNLPMLNVMKFDSNNYMAMTAISVDRELPATKEFVPKFMLKGGNILEAEARGGPFTIEKVFNELENYRLDHRYMSPAIPFELLVTDRLKEKDTTKWITKIYYPIY